MINLIFKCLLTISSISLFVAIYLIKSKFYIFEFNYSYIINSKDAMCILSKLSLWGYFIVPILLVCLILKLSTSLSIDEFKRDEVIEIENVGNNLLPSYLGYFFVALSIPDGDFFTMFTVFLILGVFVFLSQSNYFNPVFFIFGYKSYQVKTKNGVTLFLISNQNFRRVTDVVISKAYRINNFTFIEKAK